MTIEMNFLNDEKGQTVILLLLVMVIGLTIGLSVVTRSVLDVKLSSQSEESSRAFNAAEAGIEKALTLSETEWNALPNGTLPGDVGPSDSLSHYSCSRVGQAGGQNAYVFPYKVEKDKAAQLYLADVSNLDQQSFDGTHLRVLWGNAGPVNDSSPALEVSLFYKDTSGDGSYSVAKFALDPRGTRGNNFCTPGSQCTDSRVSNFTANGSDSITTADTRVDFQFGATIDVTDFNNINNGGTKFLQIGRFRLLYNVNTPHVLGVRSVADNPLKVFPSQGFVVDCLGSRDATNTQRRVKVFENYPSLPDVFDYVLFNGNPGQVLGH